MMSWQEVNNKTFAIKARIKGLDSQIAKKQRYLLLLPGGFGALGVVAFGIGTWLLLYSVPGADTLIGSGATLTTQAYQALKDIQNDLEKLKLERFELEIELQQLLKL
jgi:hypothetical protein